MIKKTYNRILDISEDSLQITLIDGRFYRRNGEYYPSISTILQCYPKGVYYEDYLKRHGYNSDYLRDKAAEEGTMVHNMIENYLKGDEICYLDNNNNPKMEVYIWKMFLNFVEFWTKYKPTLIESEVLLYSDELKVAGTSDLVCEIKNGEKIERWLIDFKTSNSLHTSQELQIEAYKKCYEECYDKKIDRTGILWLKSLSRTEDKTGKKIKGKGWELVESNRTYEENIKIFKSVLDIFNIENPKFTPSEEQFVTKIKLN